MKFLIAFFTISLLPLLLLSQAYSSDLDAGLKFDNPVRDCKTYVPKKDDIKEVFSNISTMEITKTEKDSEVFANLSFGVAFGKCMNGEWIRLVGTPMIIKATVERGVFNKKAFALNPTYMHADVLNDGRTGEYSSHLVLGLDVSVTQILNLLDSGKDSVGARVRYELFNGSVIFASYVFTKNESGEILIKVKTLK